MLIPLIASCYSVLRSYRFSNTIRRTAGLSTRFPNRAQRRKPRRGNDFRRQRFQIGSNWRPFGRISNSLPLKCHTWLPCWYWIRNAKPAHEQSPKPGSRKIRKPKQKSGGTSHETHTCYNLYRHKPAWHLRLFGPLSGRPRFAAAGRYQCRRITAAHGDTIDFSRIPGWRRSSRRWRSSQQRIQNWCTPERQLSQCRSKWGIPRRPVRSIASTHDKPSLKRLARPSAAFERCSFQAGRPRCQPRQ